MFHQVMLWIFGPLTALSVVALGAVYCLENGILPGRRLLAHFRRLPVFWRCALLLCVGHLVVYGSTKPGTPPPGQDGTGDGAASGENGGTGGDSGLAGAGGGDGPTEGDGSDTGADSGLSGDSGEPWPGEGARFAARRRSLASDDDAGGFSAEDVARGFVRVGVSTDETHSFAMPGDAAVVGKWRLRGAYEDWERLPAPVSMVVFPYGVICDRLVEPEWTFAPLETVMSVAPEGNWGLLGEDVASRVWWRTGRGSTVVTWENMLGGRETNELVCVQAEFFEDGRFVYRYGTLPGSVRTNAVIGVAHGGHSLTVDPMSVANLTSVWLYRLRPEDVEIADEDGDGVTTYDEVMLYGTDPHAFDTDGDGRGDGEEIALGRDPLQREESDAEIRSNLLASATNAVPSNDVEHVEGELRSRLLWAGFAFEVGGADLAALGSEQDGGAELAGDAADPDPQDGEPGVVIFDRTLEVDRKGGWQEFFLSSGPDAARGWALDGCVLSWTDDAGGSGIVTASPKGDSLRLPVSPAATSVRVRLVAEGSFVRSLQPVYLIDYTPHFTVTGGRAVPIGDGRTAYVDVSGSDEDAACVTIDRSQRPSKADPGEDELSEADLPDMTGEGVWTVLPWEQELIGGGEARRALRMAGRSAPGTPHGDLLIRLNPQVTYGVPHANWSYGVEYVDGGWQRISRFPFESREDREGVWSGGFTGCGCTPTVSCAGSDLPYVQARIEEYDWYSAEGVVTVFGTEVWRGLGYHEVFGSGFPHPEPEVQCGCPETCPHCDCNRRDGDSSGSVRFRVSLGGSAPGGADGYVWFLSEGPVVVSPSIFTVSVREGSSVDEWTSGGTRFVSSWGQGGRDVEIAPATNGVAVTVRPHGTADPIAVWEVVNPDGNADAVRIVRRETSGVTHESHTYVFSLTDCGNRLCTVTDDLAGDWETVEHTNALDAEGRYTTVRRRYRADGTLLSVETQEESLGWNDGGAYLDRTDHAVTTFETGANGVTVERTVTDCADREETVTRLSAEGYPAASNVVTTVTAWPDGNRTERRSWDGMWSEDRTLVTGDAGGGRTVLGVSAWSDGVVRTNSCVRYSSDGSVIEAWEADPGWTGSLELPGDDEGAEDDGDGAPVPDDPAACAYDPFGRLVSVSNAVWGTVGLAYDAVGNVTALTTTAGVIRATYDVHGTRTSVDLSQWTGDLGEDPPEGRVRMMSRSLPAPEHLTAAKCVEYYLGGSGEPRAMPFSDITFPPIDVREFEAVKSHLATCSGADFEITENTVGNVLYVPTVGRTQWFLGHVGVRLTGTLRKTSGCAWTLVNGRLAGVADTYDFDRAARKGGEEIATGVGRMFLRGKAFKIHFIGDKPISGSGGCRGAGL